MSDWTKEQEEYIESIADDYGVNYESAYIVAELLGVDELYDGFISSMQDIEHFE